MAKKMNTIDSAKKLVNSILDGKTFSESMAICESTDPDDEKVTALLQFLDIEDTPENRERVFVSSYNDNVYNIDDNYNSFLICTDEEADDEFYTSVENLIDDLGLEAFTEHAQSYIIDNCLDDEPFLDYYLDDINSYAQDIANETESPMEIEVEGETVEVTNRLLKECLDKGVISEDDLSLSDIEDGDYVGDEDLVELYCEHFDDPAKEGYVNAVDWYKFNFGSDALRRFIADHDSLDIDEVVDYIKGEDGRGNELNSWDGTEYEETVDGTDYFIYPSCDYKNID